MLTPLRTVTEAEEPIPINILIPRYRLRVINVFRSSTIGFLKKCLDDSELIFNGQLLDDSHTIEFYGIQPNDSLVAIPGEPAPSEAVRWMKITLDSDTFEEAIRTIASRTSRVESFRLQDLRVLRLESRPRGFRRLCREWRDSGAPVKVAKATTPTHIPLSPASISEEPLPVCW